MPQAESVAIPKRLPLVVQPENRNETADKDARLINGYVEKSDSNEYYVYKRPGLLRNGTAKTGNGYGVYNWLGDVYAIFGATMYKNGVALTGTLNTAGGVYQFSQSLGATLRLQFGNGVASYNYDAVAGIVQILPTQTVTAGNFLSAEYTILTVGTTNFTLIGAASNTVGVVFTATGSGAGTGTATTASNFPSPALKGWAYLDGTTYVGTPDASVRGCAEINDPTNWSDVSNTLAAQIEADNGVALAKQLVYVLLLGQWSTEVFYDQANPAASPLGPVQGAKLSYGCASADSVQDMDGILLWVAANRSAAKQVVMVENLKATVVSTKPIERLLGEADFSTVFSFSFKYEGHRFYGITLKNDNLTLVYDLSDRLWSQWTDTNGDYWPIVSATYSSDGTILQHETNGRLYVLDSAYTTDDGEGITFEIYTPNFDAGVRRRKTLNVMEFIADQTPGSVLQARCNDHDYVTDKWTNFRRVDLGVKKPILTNNGTFMRRAYHFRHRAETRLRIQAIELQMDLGTL